MTERRIYDDQTYAHSVTFSCYKRRKILDDDGLKRIVIGVLASQLSKQSGKCAAFVIMPDHVHALVWFPEPDQLSYFMKQWKQRSSVQIKKRLNSILTEYASQLDPADPVWQRRFYSFNVYSYQKLIEKLSYLHANPVRAGLAKTPEKWPYSSARWYSSGKSAGLPIELPE